MVNEIAVDFYINKDVLTENPILLQPHSTNKKMGKKPPKA